MPRTLYEKMCECACSCQCCIETERRARLNLWKFWHHLGEMLKDAL